MGIPEPLAEWTGNALPARFSIRRFSKRTPAWHEGVPSHRCCSGQKSLDAQVDKKVEATKCHKATLRRIIAAVTRAILSKGLIPSCSAGLIIPGFGPTTADKHRVTYRFTIFIVTSL
jgi:hypothetical protein